MEEAGHDCPIAKVLGIKDLVEEIMVKVESSKCMFRFSAVNSASLEARRSPCFARRFAETNKPAFLGFLVESQHMRNPSYRRVKLVYPEESRVEESAVALRPTVNLDLLAGDEVISSSGGCVLTAGYERDESPTNFYTSFPTECPRIYNSVANTMPKIPVNEGQHTKNTYGQFGVMRKEGPSGLSFFVKDAADFFFCSYAGTSFCSKEDIYIHVCELVDGMWIRHVSPPIKSPDCALFHRNPYSVLHGDTLFMMYLVGYIVCLDLVSKSFSKILLPVVVRARTRSWYDYTVCQHSQSGIALVQYWGGKMDTWILRSAKEECSWSLHSTINLVEIFEPRMPLGIWARMLTREANPLITDDYFSLQLRSASPNAKFVLLTLAFDPNMYMVDMINKKVHQILKSDDDGLMGRVHALTEEWPPRCDRAVPGLGSMLMGT